MVSIDPDSLITTGNTALKLSGVSNTIYFEFEYSCCAYCYNTFSGSGRIVFLHNTGCLVFPKQYNEAFTHLNFHLTESEVTEKKDLLY